MKLKTVLKMLETFVVNVLARRNAFLEMCAWAQGVAGVLYDLEYEPLPTVMSHLLSDSGLLKRPVILTSGGLNKFGYTKKDALTIRRETAMSEAVYDTYFLLQQAQGA